MQNFGVLQRMVNIVTTVLEMVNLKLNDISVLEELLLYEACHKKKTCVSMWLIAVRTDGTVVGLAACFSFQQIGRPLSQYVKFFSV
jgi:hypothetical protein